MEASRADGGFRDGFACMAAGSSHFVAVHCAAFSISSCRYEFAATWCDAYRTFIWMKNIVDIRYQVVFGYAHCTLPPLAQLRPRAENQAQPRLSLYNLDFFFFNLISLLRQQRHSRQPASAAHAIRLTALKQAFHPSPPGAHPSPGPNLTDAYPNSFPHCWLDKNAISPLKPPYHRELRSTHSTNQNTFSHPLRSIFSRPAPCPETRRPDDQSDCEKGARCSMVGDEPQMWCRDARS